MFFVEIWVSMDKNWSLIFVVVRMKRMDTDFDLFTPVE